VASSALPTIVPAPSPTPAPSPRDATAPDLAPDPVSHPPPPFALSASSRVDTATLPRTALGAELGLGFRPKPLLLEVAATYWFPETAALATAPTMGGRYSMVTGTVRACYEVELSSFTLGPCAAGELDRVTADGYGKLVPGNGSTGWVGLAAGGVAAWRPARWGALKALAEANVPLARPSFVVDGSEAAYRVPVVAARAALGFELNFP
jgi:hypothetical protein